MRSPSKRLSSQLRASNGSRRLRRLALEVARKLLECSSRFPAWGSDDAANKRSSVTPKPSSYRTSSPARRTSRWCVQRNCRRTLPCRAPIGGRAAEPGNRKLVDQLPSSLCRSRRLQALQDARAPAVTPLLVDSDAQTRTGAVELPLTDGQSPNAAM